MAKKNGKKVRINLRVDAELIDWVKRFASSKDTTMTALVIGSFMDLRRRYGGAPPKIEQI